MKKGKLTLSQRQIVFGYTFIAPWLIGFLVFFVANLLRAIQYSFNEVVINPSGGYTMNFVGFENYVYALTQHATFNKILLDSLSGMLIDVPLIVFFSLFMAILLNQKFKGRTVVRAIFFLPVILMSSAIENALASALLLMLKGVSAIPDELKQNGFSADYLINTFSNLGFPPFLLAYIEGAVNRVYEIVRGSGVQILIFLAALQAIPGSLYEVAKIEGATAYETFWKITFPMVSPLILTNVVYTIVDSFTVSEVVDTAYTTAFTNMNFGLSSAMSLLSSVSVSIVLLVVGYFISRKTFYHN